jgi:hypothetical protein
MVRTTEQSITSLHCCPPAILRVDCRNWKRELRSHWFRPSNPADLDPASSFLPSRTLRRINPLSNNPTSFQWFFDFWYWISSRGQPTVGGPAWGLGGGLTTLPRKTQYLSRITQVKANEVGGACSTHGRGEESVQGFGGKARRKETTWKTKA